MRWSIDWCWCEKYQRAFFSSVLKFISKQQPYRQNPGVNFWYFCWPLFFCSFFFLRSTWSHFVCFVLSPLDQVENLNGHMKIYKRNSVGIAPSSFTVNVVLGLLGGLHFWFLMESGAIYVFAVLFLA